MRVVLNSIMGAALALAFAVAPAQAQLAADELRLVVRNGAGVAVTGCFAPLDVPVVYRFQATFENLSGQESQPFTVSLHNQYGLRIHTQSFTAMVPRTTARYTLDLLYDDMHAAETEPTVQVAGNAAVERVYKMGNCTTNGK